jgi:hypothetical protein
LPTHHDPPPPPNESCERESWHADNHELFFNIIGPNAKCENVRSCAALRM